MHTESGNNNSSWYELPHPSLPSLGTSLRKGHMNLRMLLLAGFGAMLVLILISGVVAVRIAEEIRSQETEHYDDFQDTQAILSRIEVNLLKAQIGTNDFLQNRARDMDDFYERQLWGIQQELENAHSMQEILSLTLQQKQTWNLLQAEVDEFWKMLAPIFEWTPRQKAVRAGRFLREEVFPRRSAILEIADQFSALNRQILQENQRAVVADASRQFRRWMLILGALSFLIALVVALWTTRYAGRLEGSLQAQYEESNAAKTNLQRLSAKLVHAQEDERRTIARELHDQIGQALTAIKVNLGMLEQKTGTVAPEIRDRIHESKVLAEQMVQEVRELSRLLRPAMLDDLGLVPALEWYVRSFSRRFGIPVKLNTDRMLGRLPEEWETCIYRSVQETLTNTIRHSEATEVFIHLEQTPESLTLTVEDNGQGFELSSPAGGLGLIGMRERAHELGGTLSVESNQQSGTRIRIVLPAPPPAAAGNTIRIRVVLPAPPPAAAADQPAEAASEIYS